MRNIKKISIIIVGIMILQIVFPVFKIWNIRFINNVSYAEEDYSYIEGIEALEKIKDNPHALAQVQTIVMQETERSKIAEFKEKLSLIQLCPNVSYIVITGYGLELDKDFFYYIRSSQEVSISIVCKSIDFKNVPYIENLTGLYLDQCKVYNFEDIINLKKLSNIQLSFIEGFKTINFDTFDELDFLRLCGMSINNYKELFENIRNVKNLSLHASNLTNYDTKYITDLPNMQNIDLDGTYVTDISFLENLENLKSVFLPYDVDSFDVIYKLKNLEYIYFDALTEIKFTPELRAYCSNNNIGYTSYDIEISSKVQSLLSSFNIPDNSTDEEKIFQITRNMAKYMGTYMREYEYTTAIDNSINMRCGVCHDYAILEYVLLKMMNIDVYYVEGFVRNVTENIEDYNDYPGMTHAWNVVNINGEWLGLDPLWLDNDDFEELLENNINFYFLKNTKINTEGLEYPYYTTEEGMLEKTFALQHDTYNDPVDTLGTNGLYDVKSISVTTNPSKTQYIQNNEDINLNGGVLTVTYNNGLTDAIELTNTDINMSKFDNTKLGEQTITVTYRGLSTELTIYVIEENHIKITNHTQIEDRDKKYIEGIDVGTKIQQLLNDIETNGTCQILKDNKVVTSTDGLVSTGMILRIICPTKTFEYTIVVTGDINGDAIVDEIDLLLLARYNADFEKEKKMVTNEYLRAANIVKDIDFGDEIDLLKLARILVNLDEF